VEQGEKLLNHAEELSPEFRVGEIHLVRGKQRIARGDFAGAKTSLDALLKLRRGTIEGRVLMAQAMRGLGDDGAAALMNDEAWREYVSAPGFQRRKERLWAWRARPSRPATYLLIFILVFAFFGTVVAPKLSTFAKRSPYGYYDPGLNDPDADE
jgi:hypothetical protein